MQFSDVLGLEKTKAALVHEVKADRISHAQMIIGPEGNGKLPLAIAFAQYILCDQPGETDSCGTCPSCQKVGHLVHPDLHFVFPVVISRTDKVSSSEDRIKEWNEFVLRKKYFGLGDWLEFLDETEKNPIINVEESRHILQKLSLKSYSGKHKIVVIWLPELMNTQAANKLLKILEEPPEKTLFLLLCDNTETILPTILSRTQFVRVPGLETSEIEQYLKSVRNIDDTIAQSVAVMSQGSLVEALSMIEGEQSSHHYFELFVKLMRAAYAANPLDLMNVSEDLSALDKAHQKQFIQYALHIFRESIILNYMKGELINLRNEERTFLDRFARFINNQNITDLMEEFNTAYYHLDRNANAKILFTDLVIRLTKLIKKGV